MEDERFWEQDVDWMKISSFWYQWETDADRMVLFFKSFKSSSWLENYYFKLTTNIYCYNNDEFIAWYYYGIDVPDIIRNTKKDFAGIIENYIRSITNRCVSINTIRAKLIDIIDFVPIIYSGGSGLQLEKTDLSKALRCWEDYMLNRTTRPSQVWRLSKRQLNKQWLPRRFPFKLSSIRRKAQSVKVFCEFLVQQYGCHFGDYQSFPDFSQPVYNQSRNNRPITFDIEEIAKKIPIGRAPSQAFIGYRDKAIILAIGNMGLSVSELIDLNASDIDWDKSLIIGTKRAHPIIDEDTRQAMRKYFDICREKYANSAKFFLNSKGEPISRVSVFKIVKERAKQAGYNHINPQMLRERYKKRLIKRFQKSEAAKRLGVKRLYNRDL